MLECLSLAGISNLVRCLWVRPGENPRVEHLKGASMHQPYSQAEKACQGQTLFKKIRKLQT